MKNKTDISSLDVLKKYFAEKKSVILEDYFTYLRFQSISTDPAYAPQVLACSQWLADYLQKIGFDVEIWKTSGHPTLFAQHLHAESQAPTLLLYGHYDVQPIDPVELWHSPPFEPILRGEEVYARGAQDNKGQCFYTIQALRALLERERPLSLNIKLCIEGEEEIGSAGLSRLLKEKRDALQADYIAIVDMGLEAKDEPSITLGVRGLVSMEVTVEGSHADLHSGCHGGLAYNPIHALVELLASLRDSEGKITVPGFYEGISSLDAKEKSLISWEFDEENYKRSFGIPPTGGEKNFPPQERKWMRPTLEINGISGGYTGTGFKTVIPAKAFAKISCRLVPGQEPQRIVSLIKEFLEKRTPLGVTVKIDAYPGGGRALRASPQSAVAQAFSEAFTEVFGKKCQVIYSGATIPIVEEMAAVSQGQVVLLGLGLPDDQIHAPNEHFGMDRFEKGFLIISRAIEFLESPK
jgi:acetylornithine deacetylase/succinyl-diaminopimelate desuccinylase-like protein